MAAGRGNDHVNSFGRIGIQRNQSAGGFGRGCIRNGAEEGTVRDLNAFSSKNSLLGSIGLWVWWFP